MLLANKEHKDTLTRMEEKFFEEKVINSHINECMQKEYVTLFCTDTVFFIRISCFQLSLHIVLYVFACFVAFPHLQMRLQQEANQKIAELSEKAHSEAIQ